MVDLFRVIVYVRSMALVRNPLYSGEASGSVGAVTYAKNRGGAYARHWAKPVKSRSTTATVYHADTFQRVGAQWGRVFQSSRDTWLDFASRFPVKDRFGQSRLLSGFSWFMKLNLVAEEYFNIVNSTAPASPGIDYFPAIEITNTNDGFELSFDPAIPTNHAIIVFQLRTNSFSRLAAGNLVFSHKISAGTASPVLVTPPPEGSGGPGDLPPIMNNTWVQFGVNTVDNSGRASTRLFFQRFAQLT